MWKLRAELAKTLNRTVHFLVRNQSTDGSWGRWNGVSNSEKFEATNEGMIDDQIAYSGVSNFGMDFDPSGDAQRSPRALSLLQWWVGEGTRLNQTFIKVG